MHLPSNRAGFRSFLLFAALIAGDTQGVWILSGLAPLLIGIAFHLWAKGCLHRNEEVTTSGPYRFIRHPFYLGNLFIDAAIAIMSGSTLLLACFIPWWFAVYIPVMRREEAIMRDLFGDKYSDYARQVPRLFPFRRPVQSNLSFSWQNQEVLDTEVPRGLRFLAYPLFFVIAHEIRAMFVASARTPTPAMLAAVLGILLLTLLAWQTRRMARSKEIPVAKWFSRPYVFGAFLAIFIAAGFWIPGLNMGRESVIWSAGLSLVGVALILRYARPQDEILAFLLVLAGAGILWRLPWLSGVGILIWLPTWFTLRLAPVKPRDLTSPPMVCVPLPLSRIQFLLFAMVCLITTVVTQRFPFLRN